MVLRTGDKGDEVKALQRNLNKLGFMLVVDGGFGAGTGAAVTSARVTLDRPGPPEADDALQQTLTDLPDPCPPLTAAGMTFIAQKEVTNARTYEQRFRKPCFPGGESGITIGIGYDLRFVDRAALVADWGAVLPAAMIDSLAGVVKKQGAAQLLTDLATVDVPLSSAMQVFAKRSIPEFLKQTRSIYPQVDELTSAQRTALVSLVYNRGTDLDGDRRREMKTIQGLLAARKLDDVPGQFLSMTRLWDPAKAQGLITRRQEEAALWRSGFAAVNLE